MATNPYYTASGTPGDHAFGSSAAIRAELLLIQAAFDKLPVLSGNALELLRVNASGTGVETTPDINAIPVGNSTPSSGAFTTLSATGAVVLGDAAGDALTINSSAVSIPNGLNFDSNTLVVDAANNRVGIGTVSPDVPLRVAGPAGFIIKVAGGTIGGIYSDATQFTISDNAGANNFALFPATNNAAITTNGSTRLTIDSSGVVAPGSNATQSFGTAALQWSDVRSVLGNFSGMITASGGITGALTGNASTATALQTARNINGVAFDGTANITVTAAAGTLTGATLAAGVTAASLTSVGTLVSLGVTGTVTAGAFSGPLTGNVTGALTGNASTATALQTGRTIAITGDLTYTSTSFDGTGNVTAAGTLATVNANVGSFASVTVNAKGLVTAAAALSGDATTSSAVLTLATVNSNVGTFASVTVNGKGLVTAAAALSGDATTSGAVLTLATVNANVGSFGSSTAIPTFTVNAKGLITAAGTAAVVAPAGTLTGATLAAGVTASSLTSVGTLGSLGVTGTVTAGGFSGPLTGNASTATTLQTARNINSVSFNGSADITVTAAAGTLSGATLAAGVTASSLTSVGTLTSLTVSGTATFNDPVNLGGASGDAVAVVGTLTNRGAATTYSPALTAVSNITGTPTVTEAWYFRQNDVVDVYVAVSLDPTAADTTTQLDIALPIASTFGTSEQLMGTCWELVISVGTNTLNAGYILGASTLARAVFSPGATAATVWYFHFSYRVV